MEAKDFLKQLEKLNTLIENKLIEKRQWEELAYNISPAPIGTERVQTAGNHQKMEKAIVEYLDIEICTLDEVVKCYVEAKNEILKVIEQLETKEYDIIHKMYVRFMDLTTASIEMDISYSTAKALHTKALANIQKILDESE